MAWLAYSKARLQLRRRPNHDATMLCVCFLKRLRFVRGRAPSASKYASVCGVERYCQNCEKVFDMLGRGYGLHTLADVLLALVTKAVPTWGTNSTGGVEWVRREGVDRVHTCEATCTGKY